MRKIFCLLLSMALLLTGCNGSTTAEADNILTELYDDYIKVEEIIFCADLSDEALLEENGQTYYALSAKYECETVSQLKELLEKVYTQSKVQQLMEVYVIGENKIFKEIDGKLGRIPADAPIADFELPVKAADKVNDNEIVVKTVELNDILSQIEISLQKENAGWRIAEVRQLD